MRFLRWAASAAVALLAVLGVGYGFVHLQTQSRIDHIYDVNPAPVHLTASPATTSGTFAGSSNGSGEIGVETGESEAAMDNPSAAAVAWGKHIATTRNCRDCHGQDLGGAMFADGMPVFRLSASNLTPGGVGASYTDQDWVRSIRHGIGPDGKSLLFMPSHEYHFLSDQDLASLIAYLKTIPAVRRDLESNKVGPLGRILFMTGQLPLLPAEMIEHGAPRPVAAPRGATVAYGEYLAVGCTGCHGPGFSGGRIPGVPPEWPEAMNITPEPETGLGSWDRADFFRAMREGKRPDQTELRAEFMPWPNFAQFGDDELEALWLYLRTVEPRASGGR